MERLLSIRSSKIRRGKWEKKKRKKMRGSIIS